MSSAPQRPDAPDPQQDAGIPDSAEGGAHVPSATGGDAGRGGRAGGATGPADPSGTDPAAQDAWPDQAPREGAGGG